VYATHALQALTKQVVILHAGFIVPDDSNHGGKAGIRFEVQAGIRGDLLDEFLRLWMFLISLRSRCPA